MHHPSCLAPARHAAWARRAGSLALLVLCTVALLLLGGPACRDARSRGAAAAASSSGALRIRDDTGRELSLRQPAARIASLSPSHTEILFALGCGGRIVLRDLVSAYPPEARRLPATNPFLLSPEHLAGYRPDLVLLSHGDPSRTEGLRRVGLAVAILDPRTVEGVYANIERIGRLCGALEAAQRLAARLRARVERVSRAVRGLPRPRVYVETDGTDPLLPWTAGPGSFVDHLLRIAGAVNIASDLGRPYAQINAEEILARQPEVVLLMGAERQRIGEGLALLRARPGWSALEAVRRGRVIDSIHPDLLSRPGPRLIEGLEQLAAALHPQAAQRAKRADGADR